jgi:hypothetical protein
MALISVNNAENILVVLSSILLFNGVVNIPWIGKYLQQYPLIVVGVGLLLIIFKDKIKKSIKMVSPTLMEGFVLMLAAILLFNGLVNIGVVSNMLTKYPLIVILFALLILSFKDKIASTIGN